MFPPRPIFLLIGLLLCGTVALAQSVIDSAWVIQYPSSPSYNLYSDPNHWTPAEVPNNTPAKEFNVNITDQVVRVDLDATISKLTLAQKTVGFVVIGNSFIAAFPGGVSVEGKTFNVTDTTSVEASGSRLTVRSTGPNTPARFNAGTLSSFANHSLTGNYTVASDNTNSAATLQFRGADIETFNGGEIRITGAFSAIVDELGQDALRNLAHLEQGSALYFEDHNVLTNAPFLNEGSLTVSQNTVPTSFTAAASLANFDASSRTLTGGSFTLISRGSVAAPVELRFSGADIVNLGSAIWLEGGTARITDLVGNDGLRNLGRILPDGSLELDVHDLALPGPLQNDGVITLFAGSKLTVNGTFTNFDAASRTLTGGSVAAYGNAQFKFPGADIVHNASSITLSTAALVADLAGNNALRNFNDNLAAGNLVVGDQYLFTSPGDFTNAGRVETVPGTFSRFPPTTPTPAPQGRFVVPSSHRYIQTAGSTINNGLFTADRLEILGGTLSGTGTITGDIFVTDATIASSAFTTIQGKLTLSSGSHFRYQNDTRVPKPISGQVTLAGTLDVDIPSDHYVASTATFTVLKSAVPLTGVFANALNGARIPTVDGKGSVVVTYDANAVYVGQYQAEPAPAQLLNISSRAFLSAVADDPSGIRTVIIGGFIVTGGAQKEVVLRGLGPSLAAFGLDPVLLDPVLELHASNGSLIASNDDWRENQAAILASGLAPDDDREAAFRTTLAPGAYTVVVREKNGQAGNGLVEVYDLSTGAAAKLANISTRGYVDETSVLIGGIVAGGAGPGNADLAVRALGRDLDHSGISNYLADPTLEIRDDNGALVDSTDDVSDSEQLNRVGLVPADSRDAAMIVSLPPGNYTAIVRAKGANAGVTTVEFYDLRR
jgi:hypothetical protein